MAARRLSQEGNVPPDGSIIKIGDMETGPESIPQPALPTSFDPSPDFDKIDQKQVIQYFLRHMAAMLRKRALYFVRDSRSWIYQYVLPVIFVLIGLLVMKYAVVNTEQSMLQVVKNGQQQVYNQHLIGTTQKLPTPYAANPIMCINSHPNTDDGDSSYITPCMNVTYFTAVNTSRRNIHNIPAAIHMTTNYHGFSPVTQSAILNQLTGASTNYPLVPIKNAANVSYMSYYLLSNTDRYAAAVVGALSFTNIGVNGTNGQLRYTTVPYHTVFPTTYHRWNKQ